MINMKEFDMLQGYTLYNKDKMAIVYKNIIYISGIYFRTTRLLNAPIRTFAA